jgi:hypothetical protein
MFPNAVRFFASLRIPAAQVRRAKRRDDSGKSIPVTNQATAPHPIARRTELRRKWVKDGRGELFTVVITAPAMAIKIAIH